MNRSTHVIAALLISLITALAEEPKEDAFTANAEQITGELPVQLERDKTYVIEGLFLMQNLEEGWLADLIPAIMAKNFPHQKDKTGVLFQSIFSDYVTQGLYSPGNQPLIVVPKNQEKLKGVNIPAQSTLVSIRGNFEKFHTYNTTDGASARAPIFFVDQLKLWTGEVIDFSVKK